MCDGYWAWAIRRQRVIEATGGTLAVDSEPGRGTTFSISLPLAKGDA